jgi:hypothetical protein
MADRRGRFLAEQKQKEAGFTESILLTFLSLENIGMSLKIKIPLIDFSNKW